MHAEMQAVITGKKREWKACMIAARLLVQKYKNNSMAEKKSGISYEQIIKDLKARKFAPVYVLMGDESFYIDKICDFISEMCLNRKSRISIKP